jgi:hypothetical protein
MTHKNKQKQRKSRRNARKPKGGSRGYGANT